MWDGMWDAGFLAARSSRVEALRGTVWNAGWRAAEHLSAEKQPSMALSGTQQTGAESES